jgi:2-polyprenyl-3-methyl-5-hydroxy-6-metoxy-1,4-benzoquinol methylase
MEPVLSPITGRPARKIRDLPASFIRSALCEYYGEEPPVGACECDYTMWECAETGLQFAHPAKQGNTIFYRWVGRFASYYPGLRWEYGKVGEIAAQDGLLRGGAPLLDVGAGKGDFLKSFGLLPAERKLGLDLNEPAVAACAAAGFGSFCGTVDEALTQGFVRPGECALVTSFHCLEHVEDPVGFTASLLSLAAPEGRVFLSTPNSPMSFEAEWFDILNHPPHHLTRWNRRAYTELATQLGCTLRLFYPPTSLLRDTFKLFHLLRHGPASVGRQTLLREALVHPVQLAGCLNAQIQHRRRQAPHHADVILVELRRG